MMSEKRLKFTLESDRQYIGIFDEGYALTGFEVCNLLNSLYQQCEALQDENEQLRMKLKGDDYIMVSEMLSNLRKTGICDGCKNKDKPVEWYLERGFSITGQICDRYEPEV